MMENRKKIKSTILLILLISQIYADRHNNVVIGTDEYGFPNDFRYKFLNKKQ